MKRLIALILAVVTVLSVALAIPTQNPFVDVLEGAWYYDDVLEAVSLGLINGKSETRYAPDEFVTYAEVLKLAACMHQRHLNGEVTLKNGTPWYQPYVDYCAANGIGGVPEDHMNKFATRAWFMTVFFNALPMSEFPEINLIEDGEIPDVVKGSDFYNVAYALYRAGIVTGADAKHSCLPDSNIKRSEVATILVRMVNKEKRVKFTMKKEEYDIGGDVELDDSDKSQTVVVTPEPDTDIDAGTSPTLPGVTVTPLSIKTQPVSMEAEGYSAPLTLKVEAEGGVKPYTYVWKYRDRRDTLVVLNGDWVKGADTDTLRLTANPLEDLLGKLLYCTVTDAQGNSVNSDTASVYGPFLMTVEDSLLQNDKNVLVGRLSDGWLKVGDKVSVERDGKIIAIGTVEELQMFGKSLDSAVKGDRVGIVFNRTDGVRPQSGDTVMRFLEYHVIDTSDVIN